MTEEVAGLLRRTREEKGLSLKEAEAGARVPVHYLHLLEGSGDSRLLADVLYLVPFLRSYSVFLGLDPAVTVAQFVAAVHRKESQGIPPPPQLSRFFSRKRVVLLLLGLLAALAFWWLTGMYRPIPWQ
jgi:cytoskeletal protein RodZ